MDKELYFVGCCKNVERKTKRKAGKNGSRIYLVKLITLKMSKLEQDDLIYINCSFLSNHYQMNTNSF